MVRKCYNQFMKLMSEKEIVQVMERFKKQMPDPQPELYAPNPYCFLVSVVLSAQATDKSVNLATEDLYKIADSPEKMLALGEEKLISMPDSKVKIYLIPTNEELMIARDTKRLVENM